MYRNCNCNHSNTENEPDLVYENNNIMITNENTSCSCGFNNTSAFPANWMYGHSYVANQKMNQIYTPQMGLRMGTIFPELVSPYCPNQSLEEINFLKRSNTIGGGCNS